MCFIFVGTKAEMSISICENVDCMEAMMAFPDKYFELAVVDPPYGIFGTGGANRAHSGGLKKKKAPGENGLKNMGIRRENGTMRRMLIFLMN